jgi:drug/metabolite transporter (DMT)-like permease
LDALFILISILMLCIYNVLIKKFPNKFILFFLVNVFSYLGFLGVYFFRAFVLQHDLSAFHEFIFSYIDQNIPLYMLTAFSFLGSMIVSEKLLDGYDLSLVIPISQFGMLLASAGYIALGDPFKWPLLLGLGFLCAGAFIISLAAIPPSSTETMLARWRKIPKKLWLLTMIQAFFFIIAAMITYLGTKETARTEMIMQSLRRLHIGPVSFYSAFYFNLGSQFFGLVICTIYILVRTKYRDELFIPIVKNSRYLFAAVLAYFIATYTYLMAFMMTKDTTILLSLDNLSIPITLLFAFWILKEELNSTKILGSALIVLGGVIAVL